MTGVYLGLSAFALLWALWSAHWKVLLRPSVLPSVIGGVLALGLAWNVKANMSGMAAEALVGLSFQFFGASLLVAMYGVRPAIVMLAFVTSLVALLSSWGIDQALKQFFILGVLPAVVACGVMRIISQLFPKHLFIFILGHGYVAGVMSVVIPGILLMLVQQAFLPAVVGLSMDLTDWLVTLIILSFTEGSLSGMLLAVFVIYRPHWVPRFSDQTYLKIASEPAKMP
jgi:uncharacterized membrane protein